MKLSLFQNYMQKEKIGLCVFPGSDPNFFYFVQENLPKSLLLIFRTGKPVIITSGLEEKPKGFRIVETRKYLIEIKKLAKKQRVQKVGVNKKKLTHYQYLKFRRLGGMVDVGSVLLEMRAQKTPAELVKVRKACNITTNIVNKLIKNLRKFKTEKEIVQFLKIETIKNDCELAFDPIVASGKRAAVPHAAKYGRLTGFLVVDFGVKYKGYCSDMTRTFYKGKPTEKEKELYNLVLKAQQKAIDKVKVGVKGWELDGAARRSFGRLRDKFTHGLGHGVGVEIHEKPNLLKGSRDVFKANMVFTVEPGYYDDIGIRIEDTVLLTRKGLVVLTRVPKRLICF
ncbi:MAG: Xaa-Pro peptidase family protein [archaeon]